MNTPQEHAETALRAMQALRSKAVGGDKDAASELLRVTQAAVGHVENLARHPAGYPGREVMDAIASEAKSWPVNVPTIEDGRERIVSASLPDTLGSALPYRTKYKGRGKPRDRSYLSRTGFTLSVVHQLEIDGDFPTGGTPAEIQAACIKWLEADCGGEWHSFPWPDQIVSESNRTGKSVRDIVERWIEEGVESLDFKSGR